MPKGQIPWNKGKKLHYSTWNKGRKMNDYPQCGFQKGHHQFITEQGYKIISQKLKGRKRAWLSKLMIGNTLGFKKGKPSWNKGLKRETDDRVKKYADKKIGDKNPMWVGGISYEPYPFEWTEILKKSIRQRDKYTCQICGKEPAVHVHHIDYNKKNCNPNNLITLCHSCHNKTNLNRKHWIKALNIKN